MTQRHLEREKAATGACGFLNDVLCAPLCLGGSFIVGEAVLAGLMQIFSCIFCIVSIFLIWPRQTVYKKQAHIQVFSAQNLDRLLDRVSKKTNLREERKNRALDRIQDLRQVFKQDRVMPRHSVTGPVFSFKNLFCYSV